MAELFGRVRIVRLAVEAVAAAAKFARVVQFGRQPRKFVQAHEGAQPHVAPIEFGISE